MKKIILAFAIFCFFSTNAQEKNTLESFELNFKTNLKSNKDSSFFYLEKMKNLISEYQYKLNTSKVYYYWGEIEKAEKNIDELLLKEAPNKTILLETMRYKSYLERDKGNTDESLKILQESLSLANTSNEQLLGAKINKDIAMTLAASRNESEAIPYLKKSISYFEKNEKSRDLASSYNFLISMLLTIAETDEAQRYIDKLLVLGNQLNDPFIIADCNYQKGTLIIDGGDYIGAFEYFKDAKDGYTQLGAYEPLAIIYINLYRCSAETSKLKEAKKYLDSAIYYTKMLNQEDLTIHSKWYLYDYYLKMKDYKSAVTIFDEYVSQKDSLYGLQNSQLINELNVKYQAAEKDKVILQNDLELKTKNEKISKQTYWMWMVGTSAVLLLFIVVIFVYYSRKQKILNKKLKESNQFKNQLFTIIGHDLRSPISRIITSKGEESQALFAQKALNILDNLLVWGNATITNRPISKEPISLGILIDEILEELAPEIKEKNIPLVLEINENIELVIDKQELLTILRNVITNSVKYSPNDGKITISILDNGLNIENDVNAAIDSGSKLGLTIVERLCLKNEIGFAIDLSETANVKLQF